MNGLFLGNDRIMGIIFSRIYSFSSTFIYTEVKITIEFIYNVFILCLAVLSSSHNALIYVFFNHQMRHGSVKISQKCREVKW